jgi:glyoxylase-like metal-dependent hydrolase (beta-lactamase superfamily II)
MHSLSALQLARHVNKRWAAAVWMAATLLWAGLGSATESDHGAPPGQAGRPYANMPDIAPIGVRVDKYYDIPEQAKGPEIDPAKGYRVEELGKGLYMITDGFYQSVFMVYETGIVLIDAPPNYAAKIKEAIAGVSDKSITHVIYTHSHADHIAGVRSVTTGHPTIIAQEETLRLLKRAADPKRPLPTITFKDRYTLKVGSQVLELSYPGNGHAPGNTMIYAPAQKTLVFVDVIFPGYMPFRRFAIAQDIPGNFAQVKELDSMPWEKLVTGHVTRIGTHADVKLQAEFDDDIKTAATRALRSTKFVEGLNQADLGNKWALINDYINRVVVQCVNAMGPKWKTRLAGYDAFIWDQCYAMEQSVRMD